MFFLKSEKKNIKYVFSNTDADQGSVFSLLKQNLVRLEHSVIDIIILYYRNSW